MTGITLKDFYGPCYKMGIILKDNSPFIRSWEKFPPAQLLIPPLALATEEYKAADLSDSVRLF